MGEDKVRSPSVGLVRGDPPNSGVSSPLTQSSDQWIKQGIIDIHILTSYKGSIRNTSVDLAEFWSCNMLSRDVIIHDNGLP